MSYNFESLDAEEMATVKNDVKKTIERTLYHEVLRLGQDPTTYDYASHVVPAAEDRDPLQECKEAIAEAWATLTWLNSLS